MKAIEGEFDCSRSECLFQNLKNVKSIEITYFSESNTGSSSESINETDVHRVVLNPSGNEIKKLRLLSQAQSHVDLERLIKEAAADESLECEEIDDKFVLEHLISNRNVETMPVECVLGISENAVLPLFPPGLLRTAEIL